MRRRWKEQLAEDTGDFWVDREVPRISKCSALEFCKNVYSRYHPAILTGMVEDWPALQKWNEQYLIDALSEKLVSVNLTPNGRADSVQFLDYQGKSDNYFIYPAEVRMTMREFFRLLHEKNPNVIAYLSQQNDNLRNEFPELLHDIKTHFPLAEVFESSEPEAVNLWIGDERSVSSVHKDHFENFYVVVQGEKTFTLLPPTDVAFLPEGSFSTLRYRAEFSEDSEQTRVPDLTLTSEECPSEKLSWIPIDPDDFLPEEWPSASLCHPLRCTVKAGEMLYIPAMWYHRVSQTQQTISVNLWYDQRFDFR